MPLPTDLRTTERGISSSSFLSSCYFISFLLFFFPLFFFFLVSFYFARTLRSTEIPFARWFLSWLVKKEDGAERERDFSTCHSPLILISRTKVPSELVSKLTCTRELLFRTNLNSLSRRSCEREKVERDGKNNSRDE